jgi:hypothetical protein
MGRSSMNTSDRLWRLGYLVAGVAAALAAIPAMIVVTVKRAWREHRDDDD